MKNYFHVYNYSSNQKVNMAVYNLMDKVSIWWKGLKEVKNIKDKTIECIQLKNYFQKSYM